MAKITIIVPAYNVAPYLRECLDSVLAQDFQNWECVAVDDESTDEGPEILDEYAARDKRIRVIHQKNKGEGGARNSGIVAAKGEWLFFLDGDDTMAPGALAHLNQIIEKYPDEKLIRFGYEQYQDGTNWVSRVGCDCVIRKEIPDLIPMSDFFTYVWQHLYRRDVVDGIWFKEYKRGCDRVFIDDVLLNRVNSFVETDAVLYGYRLRAGSAMNSVPSVQVLKDEMRHRLELALMIEASGRRVEYSWYRWVAVYFTRRVGELIMQKTPEEQDDLWNVWGRCIDGMRHLKGFSLSARLIYNLCSHIRCMTLWRFLCVILPRWMRQLLITRNRCLTFRR